MATFREHIERIQTDLPIARVLADLGYDVRPDAGDREQQFSCDLHGDGQDSKPSARVYPDSNSWYCFACSLSRDAIETIRAKKRLGFTEAVKWLETTYQLPQLPWEDEGPHEKPEQTLARQLGEILDLTSRSTDEIIRVLTATLTWVTQDRVLTLKQTTTFWEALDQISYKLTANEVDQKLGKSVLLALQIRLDKLLHGESIPKL